MVEQASEVDHQSEDIKNVITIIQDLEVQAGKLEKFNVIIDAMNENNQSSLAIVSKTSDLEKSLDESAIIILEDVDSKKILK